MKFGYLFVFTALFSMAGCVTSQQSSVPQSDRTQSTTSDTDQNARGRARIHTELAVSYLEIRNLGIALEEAGIAQRSDPTYAPAFNIAGLIYQELKEDNMAEESFRQALRINARDSDANNNYGAFLCDRKRESEGIRYFLLALTDSLYRTPERSYVNAGVCARRVNDLVNADIYLRSALKIQPQSVTALYQLADLAYARKNFGEARAYLQRLAPVADGSPEILWLMLRNERRTGDAATQDSLAHQLHTRYPDSREAGLLSAGRFD